jgi:molecular chaperone GrpE
MTNPTNDPLNVEPSVSEIDDILFADEDDESVVPADEVQKPGDEELARLTAEVARLEAERDDARDQLLRKAADMENMRRRHTRERDEFQKSAAERVLRDMVSVLDDLDRALEASEATAMASGADALNSLLQGVGMVQRKFTQTLDRHGVRAVAALGQQFDPHLHEAIQQREDTSVPNNSVVQEFQKAYMLADRLLRPAMVVVAKGGPEPVAVASVEVVDVDAEEVEPTDN